MEWHELFVAAFAAIATTPLAFFFPECPCCGESCGVADGKPRTDPANEGTWVPSGTWRGVGGVAWTFVPNPGDDSGETWFFYGSSATSRVGGSATLAEQVEWTNICNWYSSKTTSPSTTSGLPGAFDKRATRLPPQNAVVHIYSRCNLQEAGLGDALPQTVKNLYHWQPPGNPFGVFANGLSQLTVTDAAHDSSGGAVFVGGGGNFAIINGGATFVGSSSNISSGVINGGAVFLGTATNNFAVVNDGATFYDLSRNLRGTVNGGAVFYDDSDNHDTGFLNASVVNGGAVFNDNSTNDYGVVNGGATFNSNSRNTAFGTVNGGATFNDAACTSRQVGSFFTTPCSRKFVTHPTDIPVCNGTAPNGCVSNSIDCGCG